MKIEQIVFDRRLSSRKNVCAYARVSMNDDGMLHSLHNQIEFYKAEILSHPEWNFVGVFHDKPMTGTKDERPEFQRMIELCHEGKIDMIITKTISRFARNTLTTLSYTRELKKLGIDVFFESENIHTLNSNGELFLSLYAALAQAESLSTSENCKWRIKKNFEQGIMNSFSILGYDFRDSTLHINEKEADIVRYIFQEYVDGKGLTLIANDLNSKGYKTKRGNKFTPRNLKIILVNEKYTGDAVLQKWYRENHLTKKKMSNDGVLDSFIVTDHHEAIIDKDTFLKVQKEIARKAEQHYYPVKQEDFPFKGKIRCGICGANYRRKARSTGACQICSTYNTAGKKACPSKQIPESKLFEMACQVLEIEEFDKDIFDDEVLFITAFNDNRLVFTLKDGNEKEIFWKDRSRAESWTPEMKQKAREKRYANSSNNQSH